MTGAIAVILARAGSEGVPGKNTAPVGGRACIEWTIEHALGSSEIGSVVVSSDDPGCLKIARRTGVLVSERPDDLATRTARIDDAARHAINETDPDGDGPVVILYANVPVRPDSLSDDALGLLVRSGCDSVQSFARVGKYHPWWTARIVGDGKLAPWEGDHLFHNCFRRQDLPEALVPDGGVTALTRDALFERLGAPRGPHAFLGLDRRAVVTDEGDVVDIDAPIDLVVANAVLEGRTAHAHRGS